MSQPFIHTEHLSYSYEDGADAKQMPVLHDVSLDVARGEYIAIIGHNGSGKSTFAKLLNLVLEPTDGKILIDGQDITSPDMTDDDLLALRRKVGMVFQNPDNQLVATVVEEDIAFGPENLGVPSAEIRARVDEALAAVGMTEYARHEPHRLSGGQKQRVAIAGIIAMMPDCMIFDESTAMLDPLGRREVLEVMERLHRERGITVITITHHMDEAARADRIVVLDDGRVLRDGTPEQIFSEPELLMEIGLDVPQSAALVHRLRKAGLSLDGEVGTPEACVETICRAFAAREHNTLVNG
ncbi:MAG: energy-coupling factor transporter ATPase [Clostridia bacterium]|nr:energy-coupling factor transporter ATPase [Clostridia bacterium]